MKSLPFQIVFLNAARASDAIWCLFFLDMAYRGRKHAMISNIFFSGTVYRL